jgi:hypothetical protein
MLYDGLLWTFKENFMSGGFFKVICAAVLSIGLIGQANAGLILGGIYKDGAGFEWEYVGELDLGAGPQYNNANGDNVTENFAEAQNGLEAASSLYQLPMVDLALAAHSMTPAEFSAIKIGDDLVNHKAWYDFFWNDFNDGGRPSVKRDDEDLVADSGSDGLYNSNGDVSAYVSDRVLKGEVISYVFKAVEVPEPSTLAIFALALCALGARKLKR